MRIARMAKGFLGAGKIRKASEEEGVGPATAAEPTPAGPLLVLDVGSVITRASLLDRVDGRYRLLAIGAAPTAFRGQDDSILEAVREAVGSVEQTVNRAILGPKGTPQRAQMGKGVEAVAATASGLLRVAIVGLTESYSTEAAQRAVAGINAVITASISLATAGVSSPARLQSLCRQVQQPRPDVILIVGGSEQGASEPLLALGQALADFGRAQDDAGIILFGGNSDVAARLSELLAPHYDVRPVANLRPSLEVEELEPTREALRAIWRESLAARHPDLGILSSWLASPLLSTVEGLARTVRFLASYEKAGILCCDVGGSSTTLVAATGASTRVYSEESWGLGPGALAVSLALSQKRNAGAPAVQASLAEAALNKWARPWILPETPAEMRQEIALAKAALSEAVERSGVRAAWGSGVSQRLLLGRGGALAHCPSPMLAALALVDATGASGFFEVGLDSASLLPQLGALAAVYPQAAAEVAIMDGIERLGTWVRPCSADSGSVPLLLEREGRPTEQHSLPAGSVTVLPLRSGENAVLIVGPVPDVDFGAGRGRRLRVSARGGRLGLVVDLRDQKASQAQGDEWLNANARWLQEPSLSLAMA